MVGDWHDGSPTKEARLKDIAAQLGLDQADTYDLRYQLLHRTVSALREADDKECQEALMLVHSFSASRSHLTDFQTFAERMGISCAAGQVSGRKRLTAGAGQTTIDLRLGWVSDNVS